MNSLHNERPKKFISPLLLGSVVRMKCIAIQNEWHKSNFTWVTDPHTSLGYICTTSMKSTNTMAFGGVLGAGVQCREEVECLSELLGVSIVKNMFWKFCFILRIRRACTLTLHPVGCLHASWVTHYSPLSQASRTCACLSSQAHLSCIFRRR